MNTMGDKKILWAIKIYTMGDKKKLCTQWLR
jgi:hypothetical protein